MGSKIAGVETLLFAVMGSTKHLRDDNFKFLILIKISKSPSSPYSSSSRTTLVLMIMAAKEVVISYPTR